MFDDNLDVPRPPRFPYVATLLCAACVGAAAWTWMRYSYCWDLTTGEEWVPVARSAWPDRVYAQISPTEALALHKHFAQRYVFFHVQRASAASRGYALSAEDHHRWVAAPSHESRIQGRLVLHEVDGTWEGVERRTWRMQLDPDAHRLAGPSIAGLVVGAMGVFVFGAALRHWLVERKAAAK